MTAGEFVVALEAKGFSIREKDGAVAIRPARSVTPSIKEVLNRLGGEVLAYVRQRESRSAHGVDWSSVSLYTLDRVLEVRVPWSDTNLLVAPGCRVARDLRAKDPRPGRVWCVCEVIDLLLTGVSPTDVTKVAQAKLTMSGTVVAVKGAP